MPLSIAPPWTARGGLRNGSVGVLHARIHFSRDLLGLDRGAAAVTARERAKRIYSWSLNRGYLDAIDRGEREILAAEREAVEAFAKQATSDFALLTRLDVGAIVVGEAVALINGRLEAWLRSRGEG